MPVISSPGVDCAGTPVHAMRYQNIKHPDFHAIYAGTDNDLQNKYYFMEGWKLVQYYFFAPAPIQAAYSKVADGPLWLEETAANSDDYVPAVTPGRLYEFADDSVVRDRYLMDRDTGRSIIVISIAEFPPGWICQKYAWMERTLATSEERKLFFDNEFEPVIFEYQKRSMEWLQS